MLQIRCIFIEAMQEEGFGFFTIIEEALIDNANKTYQYTYSNYIRYEKQSIQINKNILKLAPDDLRESLKTVMINYPEIFVE